MLRIFEFEVSLFDHFAYRQNVTYLKRFTRYGHYTSEVEELSQLSLKSLCQKLKRLVAI